MQTKTYNLRNSLISEMMILKKQTTNFQKIFGKFKMIQIIKAKNFRNIKETLIIKTRDKTISKIIRDRKN
jgi:hypothetical protein